jgi:poly-beta-1,6-N-acetyl-D-glucosamine synthase
MLERPVGFGSNRWSEVVSDGEHKRSYALITPVRNEEAHIARLIQCVAEQTLAPVKYVIVSNGSTDRTDEIVEQQARELGFVELLRHEKNERLGFGAKALAFNSGWERLRVLEFDFVANLDADISFEPRYIESLIEEFHKDMDLGLAGGHVHESLYGRFIPQRISEDSVAGPTQFFRRQCLEDIGGYLPMRWGGIDAAAEIMARMKGWKTRTIWNCRVLAHRPVRTGSKNVFGVRFNKGIMNYSLGYHPLFQALSCLWRVPDYPYAAGSACAMAGYFWAALRGRESPVSREFVDFLRNEQMRRLGLR